MSGAVLQLENISKRFPSPGGAEGLEILRDVNLSLGRGESISIVGKSGSGKSTLLYIASLIEKPTGGRVLYDGVDVTDADQATLARLRREKMGFVFQNSLLLEDFNALENVAIVMMNNGRGKKDAREEAAALLERLGLGERLTHRPFELSGGERQRVAIARAICHHPSIVFADEPTGALDEESQELIEDLLLSLVGENGLSLLLVTHNLSFAQRLGRCLSLSHKELKG